MGDSVCVCGGGEGGGEGGGGEGGGEGGGGGHWVRWLQFIRWWKMLREMVTVSFGVGNSAVNATWEYGDFDRKQVADNACSDFCFDNGLHTL